MCPLWETPEGEGWCPKGCQLVRDEKTANKQGLGACGPGSPADKQLLVDPAPAALLEGCDRTPGGGHRVCLKRDTQAARVETPDRERDANAPA